MSTAFEFDSKEFASSISVHVPHVEGIYDLTPDQVLLDQAEHESEVRSYPRRLPIAIKRAFGALVEDTRGQIFLDCLAGAGTLAMGYNHPEINQALKQQLDSGLPYQTLDITTEAKDRFIKRVKAFLPQEFADQSVIQFCGPSGADAVEAAIKLAKQTTGRNTMFAFRGAYHGMTNGTMGMMGNLGTKARRTGLMSDVHFMPFPYSLRCPFGLGGDAGAKQSIRYIERLLNDDEAGIMKPAAIIVEPVQGEGGVIPAPAFWLRELRRLCDEHEILLILDEIQCGVGKTGYRFAFEEAGISQIFSVYPKRLVAACRCRYWYSTKKWIRGTQVNTRAHFAVINWPWYRARKRLRSSSATTLLSMPESLESIYVLASTK